MLSLFFSVAMLEIDVFEDNNTFFDEYDSCLKFDHKLAHKILDFEFDRLALPELVLPLYTSSFVKIASFRAIPHSSNYFYRPKLFLVKSSLLI